VDSVPRLQVIATTAEGTRAALLRAQQMASDAEPIVLVIPHVTTLSALREGPADNARVVEGYQAIARAAGAEVIVRLCHCGSYRDIVRWMLGRSSLIVVGGRRSRWWPTAAQRLFRALKRAGQSVVFADVG
jgi:hypothetical protein